MSEAADETEVQDSTIDAGAAMGSEPDADTGSETPVPPADQIGYDEFVKRAARFVVDGSAALDEVAPKSYHDVDADQFRADVQATIEASDSATHTRDDSEDSPPTGVDWGALWEEFGMDSPDSLGTRWMCRGKLAEAIACSEQGISGNPRDRIDEAVEEGVLQEVRNDGGTLRGYVFAGGER